MHCVKARHSFVVLRSPTKVLQLFGGNLASQMLFGVAMAACVEAFHEDVSLSELVLINTVVSLFAGLLPIPGGIGVSEAGLTLGLTAAGLSSEIAFAVALAYRFVSFYLPPIWGWFCYRGWFAGATCDPSVRVHALQRDDLWCVVALGDRTGRMRNGYC